MADSVPDLALLRLPGATKEEESNVSLRYQPLSNSKERLCSPKAESWDLRAVSKRDRSRRSSSRGGSVHLFQIS